MLTYTNPRCIAEFEDWPASGAQRCRCIFKVEEKPGKGFRVVKTTTNPKTGQWNKPKCHTYGGPAAIVDGSDGKTYILQYTIYDFVSISQHDFMNSEEGSVHRSANPERFNELMDIIKNTV